MDKHSLKLPKKFLYSAIILLFLSIFIGYLAGVSCPQLINNFVKSTTSPFQIFDNLSPVWLFLFVFFNNGLKALVMIILGALFGLFPLYFLAFNGFLLGTVIFYYAEQEKISFVLSGILPHGIFELSAMILATAYGFWLGFSLLGKIRSKIKYDEFIQIFKYSLLQFVKIILPLIFVAAIVETFVTPKVMELFQ